MLDSYQITQCQFSTILYMKKYLFFLSTIMIVFLLSCKKDEIATFQGGNEIFFEKFYVNAMYPGTESADSTTTSFFFYPEGTTEITAPLVVLLSGPLPASDLQFGLKVIPEATTANANEYSIDPHYVFKANLSENDIRDTIFVKLRYSERLKTRPEGVRLVVELVPNGQVGTGQVERIRAKIILKATAIRPAWWTSTVEANLMGVYTEKKFWLFLNEIDKTGKMSAQLINERPDEAIKLVLQFKAWLLQQNPPILEDNGNVMQVAI